MENSISSEHVQSLDCKIGDKVYVYSKKLFKDGFMIDQDMIGEIIDLNQEIYEDFLNMEHLKYSVLIRLKNDKQITIEDELSLSFFRKYDFITLKELKQIIENNITQSQVSLQVIGNV
jgi:hypothetical protein